MQDAAYTTQRDPTLGRSLALLRCGLEYSDLQQGDTHTLENSFVATCRTIAWHGPCNMTCGADRCDTLAPESSSLTASLVEMNRCARRALEYPVVRTHG
jgi:hypothetical protein